MNAATVQLRDYPQLARLYWSTPDVKCVSHADAFSRYVRLSDYVQANALSDKEITLLRDLDREYGHGRLQRLFHIASR